jgi:hypothetical protein
MSSQLAFMHSLLDRLAQPPSEPSTASAAKTLMRDLVFMGKL